MAQLQSPLTFTSGQVLTAADLNAHVNSATLLAGSINDQTAVTTFDIQSTDTFNIYDSSGAVLRKASVDDLMRSGQIAKFDNISGNAGQNLAITPASGYAVAINGNLTASGTLSVSSTSTLNGDVTAGANLTVTGLATFNSTEALKLPVGTTVQRPASPVAGQTRYNSTLSAMEVYNGTSWDAVPVAGTSLTLPNTVNFTGTIQYNGTAIYSLSAITEETVSFASIGVGGTAFTSNPFTKPSDEIWIFEIDFSVISNTTSNGIFELLDTSGVSYYTVRFSQSTTIETRVYAKFIVNSGTTLTSETVRLRFTNFNGQVFSGTYPPNKFRIYKYRTA
jgi:hypothetical protein